MLWDPFLYCINDSIQGNSETGNKVFVLPSKVAINSLMREYNKELKAKGYIVVAEKISTKFLAEKIYGMKVED